MRPFSRWRMQRRRMYGSATFVHANGRQQPGLAAEALEGVLQGQAVEDGGEHAHVVGGGLLDDFAAGAELGPAEDVAAADDDGELHAALHDALGLAGDAERLVDADAALAAVAETFAAQLQHDARDIWAAVGRAKACYPYGLPGPGVGGGTSGLIVASGGPTGQGSGGTGGKPVRESPPRAAGRRSPPEST